MILVEIVLQEDEQVPPKGTELDGSGGAGRGQGAASQPIHSLQRVSPMGMETQSLHTSSTCGKGLREELTDYRRPVTQHPMCSVLCEGLQGVL